MAQPRVPLYVRIPAPAAEKLDRVAYVRSASKQDIVAGLIAAMDDGLTVGKHDFRPNFSEVLTLPEVADLLQTDDETVAKLADSGELPARKLGGEWRFSRAAVLKWLGLEA
jgi:excisionase family DNA binding protein